MKIGADLKTVQMTADKEQFLERSDVLDKCAKCDRKDTDKCSKVIKANVANS